MAGRDPATQSASVCELNYAPAQLQRVMRRADAQRLGGRLKAAHGEERGLRQLNPRLV
jgi:hypothetical protein